MTGSKWQYPIVFVAIALVLAAIGGLVIQQISRVTTAFTNVTEETAPALTALGQIKAASYRMSAETFQLASLGSDEDINAEAGEVAAARLEYARWLAAYRGFAADEKELEFIDQLEQHGEVAYT